MITAGTNAGWRCRCTVGIALGVLIAVALVVDPLLDQMIRAAGWREGAVWLAGARWVSRWFDFPPLVVAAGIVLGVAWLRRLGALRRLCLGVLLSGVVTGLVGLGVRCTTGRTRPCAEVEQGWYGPRSNGKWLVGVHDLNSFPSGHTIFAASMAFVPVVAVGSRAAAIGLLPLVVAVSRLLLGKHHLSDVVAALCLGFCGAWFHWYFGLPLLERWLERQAGALEGLENPIAKVGVDGPTGDVLCTVPLMGGTNCQTPTE